METQQNVFFIWRNNCSTSEINDLFKEGKRRQPYHIGGSTLEGNVQRYWSDIIKSTTGHATGSTVAQKNKF